MQKGKPCITLCLNHVPTTFDQLSLLWKVPRCYKRRLSARLLKKKKKLSQPEQKKLLLSLPYNEFSDRYFFKGYVF